MATKQITRRTAERRTPPEILKLARRMTVILRDRLEVQLRPLGVTAAQLHVLAALTREPDSSGAHLARYCQVTPQTMHALLSAAERHGWVRRKPHAQNEHTLLATLTPEGRRIFARGKAIAMRLQRRMLSALTPDDVARLETTLALLIERLESW